MAKSNETKDIVETTLEEAILKWEKKHSELKELMQGNAMKEELSLDKEHWEKLKYEPDVEKRVAMIDEHEKRMKPIRARVKKELQFDKIHKQLDEAFHNLTNLTYCLDNYLYDKRIKQAIWEARAKSKPGS